MASCWPCKEGQEGGEHSLTLLERVQALGGRCLSMAGCKISGMIIMRRLMITLNVIC